jgi:hypothetical protein
MSTRPQGIPECPRNAPIALRRFYSEMRAAVLRVQQSVIAPAPPTNLKATAKAGGIIIQFTRSDGDSFVIYRNTTATLKNTVRIDLGGGNYYCDEIGAGAETRYYWVRAKKGNLESSLVGPVSATTLALGTAITPPEQPPGDSQPVWSDEKEYPQSMVEY